MNTKTLIILFGFAVVPLCLLSLKPVYAHPGNTAADGCHYCWTNCSYWGEVYGARHCHGSSYSVPSYSYPTTPDCPLFSYYDSLSGSCKCNYGYVVDTDIFGDQVCKDGDSVCRDDYGYNSTYNSLTKRCECSYGYVFDTNILGNYECVSEDKYCQNRYGYNSEYNSLHDGCVCKNGYVFEGDECIYESSSSSGLSNYELETLLCQEDYGEHSFGFDGYCYCETGYEFNSLGDECMKSYVCPEHSTLSQGGDQCICDSGYVTDSTGLKCIEDVFCASNMENIDGKCECKVGFVEHGGGCITPEHRCISIYGDNIHYLGENSCECDEGYGWNTERTRCVVNVKDADDLVSTLPLAGQYDPAKHNATLVNRMRGRILLQTEEHGEAWYVHPETGDRYYMKDGPVAYQMMRNFGLGITDADLTKIPSVDDQDDMLSSSSVCDSNALANRLKGQILLQVKQHGEAWYIHPDKCRRIYLKDGAAAYAIMRYLSLGITDSDLSGIPSGEL